MIPPSPTSKQEPAPAAEERTRPQRWQSPWRLDDEWNHWPVQHPPSTLEPAPPPPSADSRSKQRTPNAAASQTPSANPAVVAAKPPAPPTPPTPAPTSRSVINPQPPATSPATPPPPPPPSVQARPQNQPAPSPTTARLNLPPPRQRPGAPSGKTGPRQRSSTSWGSAIILSLGMLGFTLLAWIYWQDSLPVSDEDLRIALPVDQTPVTTAPQRLHSFLESVVPLENSQLADKPASQWDTPSLAKFVTSNGVALDNLRDLLEDADWHPRHASWHATDLGAHPAWLNVSLLFQAQAAYLMRRGDEENAFTTAIDLAELSRRLQDLWTWPSFAVRSQDLHIAAMQAMAELLQHTRLNSQQLHDFQDQFTRCQPSDEELKGALNAFYIHEKKILLGPSSGEPLDTMPSGIRHERPGRLFFKINQTLGLFASAFRELKNEVSTAPYAAFNITGERIRRTRQTMPQFYQPNATGEKYFSDRINPYLDLPEDHSLCRAHHDLVRIFFALRRYAADRQKLPSGLTDLFPAYLAEIPIDPFSGEPFHYDPLNSLLFSVGINLIAEGGKPTIPPLDDNREPTVRLGISIK